jgi:hypothetical protein
VIRAKSAFPSVTCGLAKCGLLNALKKSEQNPRGSEGAPQLPRAFRRIAPLQPGFLIQGDLGVPDASTRHILDDADDAACHGRLALLEIRVCACLDPIRRTEPLAVPDHCAVSDRENAPQPVIPAQRVEFPGLYFQDCDVRRSSFG